MLARPETRRCIECGLAYGTDAFGYHEGRIENGPAYWSDRGILCSPAFRSPTTSAAGRKARWQACPPPILSSSIRRFAVSRMASVR